jgi:hypothetical protein
MLRRRMQRANRTGICISRQVRRRATNSVRFTMEKSPRIGSDRATQSGVNNLRSPEGSSESETILSPAASVIDRQLVAELSRRGITEKRFHALLANLKPGQNVIAQLELAAEEYAASRDGMNMFGVIEIDGGCKAQGSRSASATRIPRCSGSPSPWATGKEGDSLSQFGGLGPSAACGR